MRGRTSLRMAFTRAQSAVNVRVGDAQEHDNHVNALYLIGNIDISKRHKKRKR